MAAPTAQKVALALLRDRGILSLAATGPQANLCRPTDIDDTALCMSQAFQEIAQESAVEQLCQPGNEYLRAPTAVTLTATQGSATISAFTTWAAWMEGCTIRISGDTQDNELLSATSLARPFVGSGASGISATVYHDCITRGSDVEKIIGPLLLDQNRMVTEATSRGEFIQRSGFRPYSTGYPITGGAFNFAFAPFWSYGNKPTDFYPTTFFLDTCYDPTLDYVKRRIRLSPMPTVAQSIGWTNKMTPLRVTSADIVSPLTTLAVAGTLSDASAVQSYTYLMDVNGYRMFKGVSAAAYSIFFHPGLGTYIICATLNAAATPAAYWASDLGTSPLGTYTAAGSATGVATVTTSDSGGGAADPGTKIPCVDGWIESIFLPVARAYGAMLPTFHNSEIRPAIQAERERAIRKLHATPVSSKPGRTGYL